MNENGVDKFLLLLDWPKTTPISDFDMVFRAVACVCVCVCVSVYVGGGGGGGQGRELPPGPVEPDKSSQWMDNVFFRLSCFDCCVLCLAIVCHFHGREIGWSTVCANSKENAS